MWSPSAVNGCFALYNLASATLVIRGGDMEHFAPVRLALRAFAAGNQT